MAPNNFNSLYLHGLVGFDLLLSSLGCNNIIRENLKYEFGSLWIQLRSFVHLLQYSDETGVQNDI